LFEYELRNGKARLKVSREVAASVFACRSHRRRRRGEREVFVMAVHQGKAWDRLEIRLVRTELQDLYIECLASLAQRIA